MLKSSRLYYRFKPYLPWRLRMGARRIVAQAQRRRSAHSWPINEAAGEKPAGWPGWPDGKKFALVLTHDVEGVEGLEKCPQLMELERSLGFRSSFNFIPEGGYQVTPKFRDELTGNGFEVGVHDLRHDGKLYWRREEFPANVRSINGYLRDWQARGFRSGFMLHDLECLEGLDIEYDASTFDTDPFEPQPEGVNTIFPFWIPRPGGGGYVELPYTLPQDSTLFLVLQEKNTDIWKKKLDWIVARGGMALINIHPDYVGFKNKTGRTEYPVAHYEEFLRHVQKNYAGQYWNALPKDVAAWYRETCITPQKSGVTFGRQNLLRQKKAAVVLYSYYASDPRPRRAAEALVRAGMEVDVICLRQNAEEAKCEKINGVTVHRVPLKRRRSGKLTYAFQYFSFLASSFLLLTAWSFKKRFSLVHVHNMPDFLVFSALVPKLRGAKIILDLHDPMPELMMTIFNLKKESATVRLLKFLEKISMRFADRIITVNLACKKIFTSRSCDSEKIQVVMNAPDESIFQFRNGHANGAVTRDPAKKFVIMFHGSIVERHGLDLAVEALQSIQKTIPAAELRIYGATTPFLNSVMETVKTKGLEKSVSYHGPKPLDEIAAAILDCDVGIIPNRRSIFTEINTPTRIFEYLSQGKPVIAPHVPGITDYFCADDLVFFELGNADDLAKKLQQVYSKSDEVKLTVKRGQEVYLNHNWSREKDGFMNNVADLLSSSR